MAGYEAMQRGRESRQQGGDDASPQAADPYQPSPDQQYGTGQAGEDIWGEDPSVGPRDQDQGFWGGGNEQAGGDAGGGGDGGGFSWGDFFDE